jgi:hypothetical protein
MKKDTAVLMPELVIFLRTPVTLPLDRLLPFSFFYLLTQYPCLISPSFSSQPTVKMKLIIVATLLSAVAAFTGTPLKTAVSYFTVLFLVSCSHVWCSRRQFRV